MTPAEFINFLGTLQHLSLRSHFPSLNIVVETGLGSVLMVKYLSVTVESSFVPVDVLRCA